MNVIFLFIDLNFPTMKQHMPVVFRKSVQLTKFWKSILSLNYRSVGTKVYSRKGGCLLFSLIYDSCYLLPSRSSYSSRPLVTRFLKYKIFTPILDRGKPWAPEIKLFLAKDWINVACFVRVVKNKWSSTLNRTQPPMWTHLDIPSGSLTTTFNPANLWITT